MASTTSFSSTTAAHVVPGTVTSAFLESVELSLGFNPFIIKSTEVPKPAVKFPVKILSSGKPYQLPQLSAQERLKRIPRSELHATSDDIIENSILIPTVVCSYDEDKCISTTELNTFDRLLATKKKYTSIPTERGLKWSKNAVMILEQLRALLPGQSNPYEGHYSLLINQFTQLSLINMNIQVIDPGIRNFSNLTDLNISHNKLMKQLDIENLPVSLNGLTAVGNHIEEIILPLSSYTNSHINSNSKNYIYSSLWCLSLGSNYLQRIPSNINTIFPNLHMLDIAGNEITDLPLFLSTIKQCKHLTHLVTYKNPMALSCNYIFHCMDALPKLQSFDDRPLNNDLRNWVTNMMNKLQQADDNNNLLTNHNIYLDYYFSMISGLPTPSQLATLLHMNNINISFLTQPVEGQPPFAIPKCTYRLEVNLTSDIILTTDNVSLGTTIEVKSEHSDTAHTNPPPGSKPGTAVPGTKPGKTNSRPGSASKEHPPTTTSTTSENGSDIDPALRNSAYQSIQWPQTMHTLTMEPTIELCRNIRFAHLSISLLEISEDSSIPPQTIATGKIMLKELSEPTDKAIITVDLHNIPLTLEQVPTPIQYILDRLSSAIENPSIYPSTYSNELMNNEIIWNNDKRKQIIKELCSTSKILLEHSKVSLHLHKFT